MKVLPPALLHLLALLGPVADGRGRRPRRQSFSLHVPRVSRVELVANATLRSGHHAFVLTADETLPLGAGVESWSPRTLQKLFPSDDIRQWSKYHPADGAWLNLGLDAWEKLRRDVPHLQAAATPFWTEDQWIPKCMAAADGSADSEAIDNWSRVLQWWMLMVGEKGSGMYFHKDGLAYSSWSATIVGRKRWVLCPYTEDSYMSTDSRKTPLDALAPDYDRHPKFGKATCADVTVGAGEMVYYPSFWWHQTQCLDTPTVNVNGLLLGVETPRPDLPAHARSTHELFHQDVRRMCADRTTRKHRAGSTPPLSLATCESYLSKCRQLWQDHASTLAQSPQHGEL